MLSDSAVAYALVDLFEHHTVQLPGPGEAFQVMRRAGVPCTLAQDNGCWSLRLDEAFVQERARLRVEGRTGARRPLEAAG